MSTYLLIIEMALRQCANQRHFQFEHTRPSRKFSFVFSGKHGAYCLRSEVEGDLGVDIVELVSDGACIPGYNILKARLGMKIILTMPFVSVVVRGEEIMHNRREVFGAEGLHQIPTPTATLRLRRFSPQLPVRLAFRWKMSTSPSGGT